MLILSLFILEAISASLCYDIQLEGVMQVGKDFLKTLNEYSANGGKLNLPLPLSFASKGKLPSKGMDGAVMRASSEPTNNTQPKVKIPFRDYIEHLKQKGKRNINYMGKKIKNYMHFDKDINITLKAVTDDYVATLQNYYNFVAETTIDSKIDKEYIFLDMIETSNRMLYSEHRKLLNDIIMGLNITSSTLNDTQVMNEKIYRYTVSNKKEEFRYICDAYEVCRQYPAFTDYCADLITELLKLSEDKLKVFLDVITSTLKSNEDFLKKISKKEDRELMRAKLRKFSDDMFAMKEFLAVMRAVIAQRFKLVDSSDEQLKMKTKAVRILIDIIDKALSMDDEIIFIDFDIIVQALRAWSGDERNNIDDIVKDFVNNSLKTLGRSLFNNSRKEFSVLVEIIMRGTTKDTDIYQDLFKFGSKYVRGVDIFDDMDII